MTWSKALTALSLLLAITVTVNCGGGGDGDGDGNTTSLSGRVVTQDGQGIGGVTITASGIPASVPGCSTTVTRSTVSAADGSFFISEAAGVSGSGTATITARFPEGDPRRSNQLIFPTSHSISISTGGRYAGVIFTAFPVYNVGGTIRDSTGAALPGVSVSLSGTDSKTAQSGSDGTYRLAQVLAGRQTITPTRPSFTFSPPQIQLTVAADSTTNDFVGTYIPHNLSGTVTVGGSALVGVTITISGPTNSSTTTDTLGAYSFTALPRGSYTVELSTAGYEPQSATVNMDDKDQTQDFKAVPLSNSIFGRITGPNGAGLPGATVTATAGSTTTATAITDASGNYILGPLPTPLGGSYTLVPSTSCPTYLFTPPTMSVQMTGANVGGADFVAAFSGPGSNSVSGLLSRAGVGVPGITVIATGMEQVSAITAADGSYVLPGLHNGTFSISLLNTGLRFSPDIRGVALCQASQAGVDFAENINWSRATHVEGTQRAIAQAGNNAISVGDRFTVLGLDPYGDTAWAFRSSGANDAAYAVTQATDGTFIVAGKTTAGSSDGSADGLVMKIAASGNVMWQTSFGGTGDDIARTVTSTSDGGALVAGTSNGSMFLMKFDTAGGVTWQKIYGGYLPLMVRADAAGYTVAAGRGSGGNLLVMKADAQGAVLSAQQFNETQPGVRADALTAVATVDGGIAFAGQFGAGAWAMKVSSSDAIVWQRSVTGGAPLGESGNAVLELPGGGIVVAGGRHLSPNDGNAFLLFFDAKGVPQKLNAYGDAWPLRKEAFGAWMTADGRIELTGAGSNFGTWSWVAMVNGDGTSTGCPNVVNIPMTSAVTSLVAVAGSVAGTDLALPVRAGQLVFTTTGRTLNNFCF